MILLWIYTKFVPKDSKNCSHIAQHDGGPLIRSDELENAWPGLIEPWMGSGTVDATRVSAPEFADKTTLVFAGQADQLARALENGAALIIASEKLAPPPRLPQGTRLFKSPHVTLAMAMILPRFDRKLERFRQEPPIHPQASLHPTAKIGRDVIVGPFTSIGAEAVIGDQAVIGPNCTIERGAKIGARTLIHGHVFFGADCEIGTDGEIHPNTTIGSDGFGFTRDKSGHAQKLPQLGRVVIGDRVEIGANCAIDRAAFNVTTIRSGAKLDNLIHIGHNNDIGEDALIAAGFLIAGSSKIGKRFMVGGGSVVTDHVTLTDDVLLGGRSTVTNDVKEPGAYAGYPLQPLKENMKTLASSVHVVKMRKQISRILKHLGLEEEK